MPKDRAQRWWRTITYAVLEGERDDLPMQVAEEILYGVRDVNGAAEFQGNMAEACQWERRNIR